jgi:hypothetical protein
VGLSFCMRSSTTAATTFRSKIDPWLYCVVLLPLAVLVFACVSALISAPPERRAPVALMLGVVALLMVVIPGWVLRSTAYVVGDGVLDVRCGPLHIVVPVADITRIVPTRTILSSPALSLDRMAIAYGKRKTVVISPADKTGFFAALRANGLAADALGGASSLM